LASRWSVSRAKYLRLSTLVAQASFESARDPYFLALIDSEVSCTRQHVSADTSLFCKEKQIIAFHNPSSDGLDCTTVGFILIFN